MKKLTRWLEYSSLPLALKWSVVIACFVSLVMGLLGWFLINQQTATYLQQNDILGGVVVDQLAFAAGEPLLAGDDLSLLVLVSQQEKNALIIGMQVFDLNGVLKASAGIAPIGDILALVKHDDSKRQLPWRTPYVNAVSFFSSIKFKDVTTGYAVVSIDQGPLKQQLNALTGALITTTMSLILIGVLLSFPLSHRLCRPIYQLVRVGEAIDSGDTRTPITIGRKDEIGRVLDAFQRMAEGMEKKREVEQAFSRFLSPTIAHQVLNRPEGSELGGITKEGSVLFCDVVGFTELSEYLSPQEVGGLLNQYFNYFSIAADSCNGTVDKFIGDCIMILFGVPEADRSHGLHAVTCGVLIQEIAIRINHQREKQGLPLVQFKIGINSGQMLAGNLGSVERMQYTVVGDTVNLTARICDICTPGQILVTKATLAQPGIGSLVKTIPQDTVKVKGRRQSVTTYLIDSESFIAESRLQDSLEKILPMEAVS
jgi:adenylate cyclase